MKLLVLSTFLFAWNAHAQFESFQKVLLPIAIEGQAPGAFGSIFETRLTLLNRGPRDFFVLGIDSGCRIGGCRPAGIAAGDTIFPRPFVPTGSVGNFLLVPSEEIDFFAPHLRVQDVSRQRETWGTEIPTIKESEALSGSVDLIDIPVSSDFRTMIRLYDFNPIAGRRLRVRIYESNPAKFPGNGNAPIGGFPPDRVVFESDIELQAPRDPRFAPGYAQLSLESLGAQLQNVSRVRVQVSSNDPMVRFWCFASVTNNATQHITVVTPE